MLNAKYWNHDQAAFVLTNHIQEDRKHSMFEEEVISEMSKFCTYTLKMTGLRLREVTWLSRHGLLLMDIVSKTWQSSLVSQLHGRGFWLFPHSHSLLPSWFWYPTISVEHAATWKKEGMARPPLQPCRTKCLSSDSWNIIRIIMCIFWKLLWKEVAHIWLLFILTDWNAGLVAGFQTAFGP